MRSVTGGPGSGPENSTLPELFREVARRYAERTALVHGPERLTYAELDARADKVAHALRECGVAPGTFVGLHLTRSLELYVITLAVLKAGGCVVPLNPAHPDAVVRRIVEEADVRLLVHQGRWPAPESGDGPRRLTTTALIERARDCDGGALEAGSDPEGPAFVMFTSGSTGRPKGVLVPHRGLTRLAVHSDEFEITENDCFVQQAAHSFAASTIEIWQSLLHGARLVVLPPRTPTLTDLVEAIEQHGVTFLSLPCGLFNLLVDQEPRSLRNVRVITVSGDFPSAAHLAKAAAATSAKVYNCYGCTEGSSLVAVYRVRADDPPRAGERVPVGRAMPLMTADVLDARLRPCAPDEPGELCIGGAGVARGYLNDSAATAEKFVPHPADPGRVLYRTGDRALKTPDGNLLLLGRSDGMVKIRGYRVETSAVELALRAHEAVDQAVVRAFGDEVTQRRLVAFYTTRDDAALRPSHLVDHLRELVQDYMIPSDFRHLDAMPLNVNGKIDRTSLTDPGTQTERPESGERMSSPLEAAVLHTWKDIIGVDDVTASDGFLENGGNSLHFVQLASNLKKVLGIDISVEEIFRHDNAEKLARHIEDLRAAG
ncbi:non-ribosomal peptide synthetase [Streptomyces smyrnaeus]|uniref:non-ribosomal peptide synthetase n=2 Tax=Streptomyces TaxID=1883 RepID=UPI0036A1AAD6